MMGCSKQIFERAGFCWNNIYPQGCFVCGRQGKLHPRLFLASSGCCSWFCKHRIHPDRHAGLYSSHPAPPGDGAGIPIVFKCVAPPTAQVCLFRLWVRKVLEDVLKSAEPAGSGT